MKHKTDLVLRKISPRLNAVLDEHQALKKRRHDVNNTEGSPMTKTEDSASSVARSRPKR